MRIWHLLKTLPRKRRTWVGLVLILLIVIALLPTIVAVTPLRNLVINWVVKSNEIHVTAESASFGWFSPLQLNDVKVVGHDDRLRVDLARMEANQSWLAIWRSAPDLGKLKLENPVIDITIPSKPADSTTSEDSPPALDGGPTFSALVSNASVIVRSARVADPVIQLDGVDLDVQILRREKGRDLIVQPVKIFDHQRITPVLCHEGLQLVAPILAEATEIEGHVSLQLNELRVPLDEAGKERWETEAQVVGIVQLHDVSTGFKGPLLLKLIDLVESILGKELPSSRLQIAEGAQVEFQMREGRVHHEGLSFFLPELSDRIVFRTSGSVGLDETLDLYVDVHLPVDQLLDNPLTRAISDHGIAVHFTGTLDEMQLSLPKGRGFLADLASDIPLLGEGGDKRDIAEAIVGGLGKLLDSRRDENGEGATPLLDRLRELRNSRQEKAGDGEGENDKDENDKDENGEGENEDKPRRKGLLRRLLDRP